MKERMRHVGNSMKPTVQAGARKHSRHQASLTQKGSAVLNVAAEVTSGNESSRHDFRVREFTPHVINVPAGLEQIIDNAINYSRVIDHRSPPTFVWRRSGGDFLFFSKNWQTAN
jgi:hypothetical protein